MSCKGFILETHICTQCLLLFVQELTLGSFNKQNPHIRCPTNLFLFDTIGHIVAMKINCKISWSYMEAHNNTLHIISLFWNFTTKYNAGITSFLIKYTMCYVGLAFWRLLVIPDCTIHSQPLDLCRNEKVNVQTSLATF